MYLTAQRVVSPVAGAQGINAFAYGHGPYVWQGAPPFTPEENPGTLFESRVEPQVTPPGNRVRSYVDVLTPDETAPAIIERAFEHLLAAEPPAEMPATVIVGPCWFRFSMEEKLAPAWRAELRALFERTVTLFGRP